MKRSGVIGFFGFLSLILGACSNPVEPRIPGTKINNGQADMVSQADEPQDTKHSVEPSKTDDPEKIQAIETSQQESTCSPDVIYVAPKGTGLDCSCTSACDLEAGRDKARSAVVGAKRDLVIQLEDGDYRLKRTFTLNQSDSGPGDGHVIVYRAAKGASPILNGAMRVENFVQSSANANIWVAKVPVGVRSRQLWVNGQRAMRARSVSMPGGYTKNATGFTLGDPAIANWPDRTELEAVRTFEWEMHRCPVVSADVSNGLVLAPTCWKTANYDWRFFDAVEWLENALELLDSPGEFYLDSSAGKLYYMPRPGENLMTADVELPILEKLVEAIGTPQAPVHDISFEGITFSFATWMAPSSDAGYSPAQASIRSTDLKGGVEKPLANITMRASHRVSFKACNFKHLGGAGLAFEYGAQANLVDSSRFEDIAAAAVMIGNVVSGEDHHPSDPASLVKDNSIKRSYITRSGADYFDAPAIFVGFTNHTTLANNEIFDVPYSGISIGWGWGAVDPPNGGYTSPTPSQRNVIEHNIISYHMRAMKDGGGIYALGAQPDSIISSNIVSNQGNAGNNIYLDNGSQFWTLEKNIVLRGKKEGATEADSTAIGLQTFGTNATNNTVATNYVDDAMRAITTAYNSSNKVETPTVLSSTESALIAAISSAAGTPLRSPEIAQGKAATASSVFSSSYSASAANDGSGFSGWSSAVSDPNAWWQVDLGKPMAIDAVELVSRWSFDQAVARRNFKVLASNDPKFMSSELISQVGENALPNRAIFAVELAKPIVARYVRIQKTAPEYFYVEELRVHGK